MKLKILLLLLFATMIPPPIFGGIGGSPSVSRTKDSVTNVELHSKHIRPHDGTSTDSNNVQGLYYHLGTLCLHFSHSEGSAKIVVTTPDGSRISSDFLTLQTFSIEVGTTPGIYSVEISTAVGNLYNGSWEVK